MHVYIYASLGGRYEIPGPEIPSRGLNTKAARLEKLPRSDVQFSERCRLSVGIMGPPETSSYITALSIVLRGLRGLLIVASLCREMPASRTASVNFSNAPTANFF